jgi:hypothetical protein
MNTTFFQRQIGRRWLSFWFIVVFGSIFFWNVPLLPASDPIEFGYRDFHYPPGTADDSRPTGEKPESKLWWTDGFWWGVLWSTAGSAYHIYRFDPDIQDWIDTGAAADNREESKVDVLWDGPKLYVVSHIFARNAGAPAPVGERGELYRFSYDSGTQTYALDAGFPVEVTEGKSETLVVAKDTTGQLWVTYVESQQVMVNHSIGGDDSNWGTPYVLPVGNSVDVTSDDISSVIAFDGQIGVMWSNQNAPKTMYFAIHQDGTSDQVWQSDAAFDLSADDHINLKTVQDAGVEKVMAAIKTSSSSILIMLLVCDTGIDTCASPSAWTNYPVYQSGTFGPTRPITLIDTDNRDLYVFTKTKEGQDRTIHYKTTDMDNIVFATGKGVP